MAETEFEGILANFEENRESVVKLMRFDDSVIKFVELELEKLEERLKKKKFDNAYLLPGRALSVIRGIRDHQSLKLYYETIFNQCIVLLVSYFGSAVHDVFRIYIDAVISSTDSHKLKREEIKINISELDKMTKGNEFSIGEILINQRNISFQDMGSIHRLMREIVGNTPKDDNTVNNIIFGQAARHIIVHKGSMIDNKFMNQIASVKPRTLLPEVNLGDRITFKPDDVTILSDAMSTYLSRIIDITSKKMSADNRK